MSAPTYKEQLKDPRWQRKRLEIMQRDNFMCTLCGCDDFTLNVHHLKYGKTPWDVDTKYLITLCEDCHEWEHEVRPICEKELIQHLKEYSLPQLIDFVEAITNTGHNKQTILDKLMNIKA